MNISARAHRILRVMANYHTLADGQQLPAGMVKLPDLPKDESPVGIYVNDPSTFADSVFFTTEGVYVFRSKHWDHVKFSDIAKTVTPERKEKLSGFDLQLRNGESFWLPITGNKDGKFFDAFEVLRFFIRVIDDIQPGRLG